MTRPACPITGRYLAEQKCTGSAHGEQPIVNRKAGAAQRLGSTPPPGLNNEWAQLARVVIAQMVPRGGMK